MGEYVGLVRHFGQLANGCGLRKKKFGVGIFPKKKEDHRSSTGRYAFLRTGKYCGLELPGHFDNKQNIVHRTIISASL